MSAGLAFCLLALALFGGGCSSSGRSSQGGSAGGGGDAGFLGPECTGGEQCDDADPCTKDRCDSELRCTHELLDGDDDGYAEGACASSEWKGGDCNDGNRTVYPGAPELCDELDNDCNDAVDDEVADVVCSRDEDGDGFGVRTDVVAGCNCPDGYIPPRGDGMFDCLDGDDRVNPGHTEFETSGFCSGGGACQAEFASYDYDCDGESEMQYPDVSDGSCHLENVGGFGVCRGSGWISSTPDCGDSGQYRECNTATGCSELVLPSRTQGCR